MNHKDKRLKHVPMDNIALESYIFFFTLISNCYRNVDVHRVMQNLSSTVIPASLIKKILMNILMWSKHGEVYFKII